MRRSAIKDLSALQIKEKFALLNIPSHVSEVMVPKGAQMFRGNIGNLPGETDGAIQYFLKELDPEWFKNMRPI